MEKVVIVLMLVICLLLPVSCTSTTPTSDDEASPLVELEHWQIGEHWQYSLQAVWDDVFVGVEYIFGDGLEAQYISTYNLHTRKKERLLSFDPEIFRVSPPSIYKNRIVWSAANISGKRLSEIDWDELNWDIFLLDLETGEVQQITYDEHRQTEPRVYDDTIVWLDNRHVENYHNPDVFDIYAYDLRTGQETRLTSSTTVEDHFLSISGNLVVWSDNRHADPEVNIHAGNEPDYNNEIYVYDLTTDEERRVTDYPGNDHYPAINGNRIVWLRQTDYLQADIFVYEIETGQETQVSHSSYAAFHPAIYGDHIVWTDARVSRGNTTNDVIEIVVDPDTGTKERREPGADIYLYDLKAKQERRLTSPLDIGFSLWVRPCIYNNFIVYMLDRQVNPITYAMRLTEK